MYGNLFFWFPFSYYQGIEMFFSIVDVPRTIENFHSEKVKVVGKSDLCK